MSQPGLGVMIAQLSGAGDDSAKAMQQAVGKRVEKIELNKAANLPGDASEALAITLENGILRLWDGGQSCCEHRYMDTDDDLPAFAKGMLIDIEVADGPMLQEDEYGDCHEQAFLKVTTGAGTFTVVTHNEHNGYYGGFAINASFEAIAKPPEPEPEDPEGRDPSMDWDW